MFLDPTTLNEVKPAELLEAAAQGHIGIDQRLIGSLLARPEESKPALIAFIAGEHDEDPVDLTADVVSLIRYWKFADGIPFLLEHVRNAPDEIPDELIEALVDMGKPVLDPLLKLYSELERADSSEVAFMLASLRIRDERILKVLLERLAFDMSDGLFLLGLYGDPAAAAPIRRALKAAGPQKAELKKEAEEALELLEDAEAATDPEPASEPFDILAQYPEEADLPVELLDEDERVDLLTHPVSSVRAAAATSFFNRELTPALRSKLLTLAKEDESVEVRARAWEALTDATENTEVVETMLKALRNPELPLEERSGLLVGLAPEADRNEVRQAMADLYEQPEGRAKALEAMWRSVHPSFRDYFAKHLDDVDLEVRRGAIWGVGYYGLKSEMEHIRKLFDDEDLRSDALFSYALIVPGELSRGRMKGLLTKVEKDARGLSEMEEQLVKAALDERLMLAGKEPFFSAQED